MFDLAFRITENSAAKDFELAARRLPFVVRKVVEDYTDRLLADVQSTTKARPTLRTRVLRTEGLAKRDDLGPLRPSWKRRVGRTRGGHYGVIRTRVFYARFVEFGTRRAPRPKLFMFNALERLRPTFARDLRAALIAAVRGSVGA